MLLLWLIAALRNDALFGCLRLSLRSEQEVKQHLCSKARLSQIAWSLVQMSSLRVRW